MKRLVWSSAVVVGILASVSCTKPSEPAPAPAAAPAPAPTEAAPAVVPEAPAEAPAPGTEAAALVPTGDLGTVHGTVVLEGTPPPKQELKRGSDPVCADGETHDNVFVVSEGKLANVVVRLVGDSLGTTPAPDIKATVDQYGCTYRPRVQGIVRGQKVEIVNSDATLHNVHAYNGNKTVSNRAQPPKAPAVEQSYDDKTEVLKLKCDVHPWMTAFVYVSPNPYFSVTDESGGFVINNVPPGKYKLETWHERLGKQVSGEVTVMAKETAKPEIKLQAK